jgi:SAM-dependent methyltransferase
LKNLTCTSCETRYEERDGVAVLVPPDLSVEQQQTAEAFASEWLHFDELHPEYEAQFLDWILPLTRESFEGKRVLDAGCGTGRHTFFAARYGAREVVAVDLGESVRTAQRHVGRLPNVVVVQADLHRLPLRADDPGFDLIYSIGVLHHLPDPRAGFLALAGRLAPGGEILAWVYGYEGNALVRRVIDPLRRFLTRHASHSTIRLLSFPPAVVLHALVHLVYGPRARTSLGRALPMSAYLSSLRGFSFRQNYSIVFDQLVAPTSHYIKEREVREWLSAAGLEDTQVTRRTGNSWRGYGRRSG